MKTSVSEIIEIGILGDERGNLSVIESFIHIPFDIKRVFYIYSTKENVHRGFHAHYKTRQALISVSGSCKVFLDNTIRTDEVLLDAPNKVLILEPNDWHEMYDFSEDCVLLVLASELYDSKDYIRDYNKFLEVYSKKTQEV
ncbi:FdtA/QdtA family cupin domain-containing protein [Lysinibacillus boronitolerans]|uniref:sugar 3,4-ketoisomerase n=1 Tax=Lysinibacillus boronitolerans TaxID=309788 RepID=UPI00216171B6|nr:FdtA/QdtA family cupin domain-containing protein [Lysinibacillus boronitolerans]MCS1394253.1 FdtA/QdtA family cupin domain-containing protein [Lysinibacillus boronitolerans]